MSVLVINTKGDGVLDATSPAEVAAIAAEMAAAEHALLHVHGGLVSTETAMKKALRLDPYYRAAGLLPVFPVWESGLWETVRNNWKEIFDEKLFQALLKKVLKHAGGKLVQAGAGRATGTYQPLTDREVKVALEEAVESQVNPTLRPRLDALQPAAGLAELSPEEGKLLRTELEESAELQEAMDEVMLGLNVPPPPASRGAATLVRPRGTHLSPHIKNELRSTAHPGARGIFSPLAMVGHAAKILFRVIKRFIQGRAHGLYTTVVEEILRELYLDDVGGKVWGMMKKDTEQTFDLGTPGAPRGGSLFWQEFGARLLEREAAGQPLPKLSIVAHSAGAIWTCHCLAHLAGLQARLKVPGAFRIHRMIFLAPACSDELFAEKILAKNVGLFLQFRLFGLSDSLEGGYWEVPVLYPKSLLYLVSGLFEGEADQPLTGMQRYFDGPKIYATSEDNEVRQFLSPAGAAVWSAVAGTPGLQSDAVRHGGFDNTPPELQPLTMESVIFTLKN